MVMKDIASNRAATIFDQYTARAEDFSVLKNGKNRSLNYLNMASASA
jgi:hypothetical protein